MKPMPLFFLVCVAVLAQPTGPAKTQGACSPAITGHGNTININVKSCGLNTDQIEDFRGLFRQILEKQVDPKTLLGLLDDMNKRIQHIDATMPHTRDFDLETFRQKLAPFVGPPIGVTIDADTLSPFVLKLKQALPKAGLNLINNGTYRDPLTIQFDTTSGNDSQRAAEFLRDVLQSFQIRSTTEGVRLGGPNQIRIRISSEF
jgi:hypothetical protein